MSNDSEHRRPMHCVVRNFWHHNLLYPSPLLDVNNPPPRLNPATTGDGKKCDKIEIIKRLIVACAQLAKKNMAEITLIVVRNVDRLHFHLRQFQFIDIDVL